MQQDDSKFLTFMTMAEFSQLVEATPDAWAIAARAYKITIPEMRERVERKDTRIVDFMVRFIKQVLLEYPATGNVQATKERIPKIDPEEA